jgi:hypothetical protein
MARLLFARGAIGELIRRVQAALGLPEPDRDGWFGKQTQDAVKAFQNAKGLTATGAVDVDTWHALMHQPIPDVRERSLQLTAHFEGHDFTLAQGNFDGAGITWGIIGFTLKGGELGRMILDVRDRKPELLGAAFGTDAETLVTILQQPWAEQLAFADSISLGTKKTRLAEPWRSSFARFGSMPEVQALQLERARHAYYEPALATAAKWRLTSELGIALAFDVHVQNGIKKKARDVIEAALAKTPAPSEAPLRVVIANAVAEASAAKWVEDVRSRKLAIASGAGFVHGGQVTLRDWGLQDLPA